MFNMSRKHAGQALRRRDTREHVGLYLTAFNAWATGQPISQLRFTPRDTVPTIAQVSLTQHSIDRRAAGDIDADRLLCLVKR